MSGNMMVMTRATLLVVLTFVLAGVAIMPALAGDEEDIVGRWDNPATDASYIRFNADGTFKWVTLLKTAEGKYRFLGKEVIEFDTPGILYGRNRDEVKYRLAGDTLDLKLFGEWIPYKRVR